MAIKKIPKNTIVFHLKEKLFLIRPHGGDSLSYTLSEIKNAKQSHVLPGPFAYTKKGQKKSFGSEPFFRINERGETSYMTWVTKEEGLTIARIKKPGDWEVVSQYEEISRPAVFVEAPGTEKIDYIYTFYASGSATLSVARLGLERKQFKEIGPVARLVKGTEYGPLTVLRAERVAEGILIFYTSVNGWGFPMVDALLVDKNEPTEVLWRSPEPLWEAPLSMPLIAPVPVAIVHSQNKLFLYAENHDGGIDVLSLPKIRIKLFPQKKTSRELSDKSTTKKKHRTLTSVELTRYAGNPLLEPVKDNHW